MGVALVAATFTRESEGRNTTGGGNDSAPLPRSTSNGNYCCMLQLGSFQPYCYVVPEVAGGEGSIAPYTPTNSGCRILHPVPLVFLFTSRVQTWVAYVHIVTKLRCSCNLKFFLRYVVHTLHSGSNVRGRLGKSLNLNLLHFR